jgi:hypothetical protein
MPNELPFLRSIPWKRSLNTETSFSCEYYLYLQKTVKNLQNSLGEVEYDTTMYNGV